MGMNTTKLAALLSLALCAGLLSCGPNDEPVPCISSSANAGFKVYEVFGDNLSEEQKIYVPAAVIRQSGRATFLADSVQGSYRWRIGDDARVFTTRQVRLQFTNQLGPTTVGLRTNFNNRCGQSSTDSTTATFRVLPSSPDSVYGYYQGALSTAPSDTFTLRLAMGLNPLPNLLKLDNFPKGYVWQNIGLVPEDGYYKLFALFSVNTSFTGGSATQRRFLMVFDASSQNRTIQIEVRECIAPNQSCDRVQTSTFTGKLLSR
jgi:hypothetical protein